MTHITHNLMLNLYFTDAIYNGRRTFDIRRNDRGFQTGDHIVYTPFKSGETDRAKMYPEHPIKDEEYEIVYILNGWGLKEDFVVLGIRRVEDGECQKRSVEEGRDLRDVPETVLLQNNVLGTPGSRGWKDRIVYPEIIM